ncbi:MAG: hypothetical protein INF44_06540 [Thalassospira sp.]|nr:hypothetical protein [Thalassospira sp.]
MTNKKKPNAPKSTVPAAPTRNLNNIDVGGIGIKLNQESQQDRMAEIALSPIVSNGMTAAHFARRNGYSELGLTEAIKNVNEQTDKVRSGDLSAAETMLFAQAMALDAMYSELARRACLHMGEHLPFMEAYLRLAFKAQSQCRTTLEALAEIKNPRQPATFVKQQNLAHNQQVNNTIHAGAGNLEKTTNELLEASLDTRMDSGTQSQTSGSNPTLETVG